MKNAIFLFLLLFSFSAVSQVAVDTSTLEKKARYYPSTMAGKPLYSIPSYSVTRSLKAITDLAVMRTPFLTQSDIRVGKADTARVVQVIYNSRVLNFRYDQTDTTTPDDSATCIRHGGRRYKIDIDYVTPDIFGAVGGGIIDETEAIQKSITAASLSSQKLWDGQGKTFLTGRIELRNGVRIRNFNIKRRIGDPLNSRVLSFDGKNGITIEDFSIDLLGVAGDLNGGTAAIGFITCQNILIQRGRITNSGYIPISAANCDNVRIQKVVIKDTDTGILFLNRNNNIDISECDISGGTSEGISFVSLTGEQTTNANITKNWIYNKVNSAGIIYTGLYGIISENTIYNCLTGVTMYDALPGFMTHGSETKVVNNRIYDIDYAVRRLGTGSEAKLNKIKNCRYTAVSTYELSAVSDVSVESNEIFNAAYGGANSAGVEFSSTTTNSEASYNKIRLGTIGNPFSQFAISIRETEGLTIHNNDCSGFYIGSPPSPTFKGSTYITVRNNKMARTYFTMDYVTSITSFNLRIENNIYDNINTYAAVNSGVIDTNSGIIKEEYYLSDKIITSLTRSFVRRKIRYVCDGLPVVFTPDGTTLVTASGASVTLQDNQSIVFQRETETRWTQVVELGPVINATTLGLGNVDNTSDLNKPISTATQTALNAKEPSLTVGLTSQYYRGDKSWQTLNSAAVGLGNVNNTSDASKPVSTATQTALDLKANDNGVVHTAGTETIPGSKTFSSLLTATAGLTIGGNLIPSGTTNIGSSTSKINEIYAIRSFSLVNGPDNATDFWLLRQGASGSIVYAHPSTGRLHVGVSSSPPTEIPSARFVVKSTTEGIKIPELTTAQRNAISSPSQWLILVCTDCIATDGSTGVLQMYNGSTWKNTY